jgi:hypothetical protein
MIQANRSSLEQDAAVIAVIEMGQSNWLVAEYRAEVDRQPLKSFSRPG